MFGVVISVSPGDGVAVGTGRCAGPGAFARLAQLRDQFDPLSPAPVLANPALLSAPEPVAEDRLAAGAFTST